MPDFAANLRRLMARQGTRLRELIEASGLDERTIKNILNGSHQQPHARTLHRLAQGLGVEVDELFQSDGSLAWRKFDQAANPAVNALVAERPEWFAGWTNADFAELCSRFGVGGPLTRDGVEQVVASMNHKRDVLRKVVWLLESDERSVLAGIVDVLFAQATSSPAGDSLPDGSTPPAGSSSPAS